MMRVLAILGTAALLMVAVDASAARLFVSTTGDDANDGLSWATAKASPRAALDVAHSTLEADTVRVAEGTYILAPGDGNVSTAVALLGGYPPSGGTARDPAIHPTVFDLGGLDSKVVYFDRGSDGSILDGFILRRGASGVGVHNSGPLIRDCIMEQNALWSALTAPGLWAEYTATGLTPLRIEDCVIRDNHAGNRFGRPSWSAIAISSSWFAGAMDFGLVMSRTLIERNLHPAGLEVLGVGYVFGRGTVRLKDVALRDNPGGLLYIRGVDMVNVLAADGVIDVGDASTCNPGPLRNVTTSSIEILNCNVPRFLTDSIVWGTDRPISGAGLDELVVTNSLVQGGWPSGTNVIDADPLFTTGPEGGFYLSDVAAGQPTTSPCVDAGSVTASEAGLDAYTTRADSVADAGMVDLGYHPEIVPIGGLNVRRGPVADGLAPYRTVADLPFTDSEGTLTGPWFRLLCYDVPGSAREIIVLADRAGDAVRVEWR